MEQLSARLGRMLSQCDADSQPAGSEAASANKRDAGSEAASANEMQPNVSVLPLELLWHINSFLTVRSASRLATACSSFCSALRSLPHDRFRREIYRRCGLVLSEAESHDAIDWKSACSDLHVLWTRLHDLSRIHDHGQKYLRWIDGRVADSPEVRHVLVGLSLLPARVEDLFCGPEHGPLQGSLKPDHRSALHFLFGRSTVAAATERWELLKYAELVEVQLAEANGSNDALAAAIEHREMVLAHLDRLDEETTWGGRGEEHDARAGAARCFDVRRLLALLRWVLGDGEAPAQRGSGGRAPVGPMERLRLLLAEFGQILCRDSETFIDESLCLEAIQGGSAATCMHPRQAGSFAQVAVISNCDPENRLRYWAS